MNVNPNKPSACSNSSDIFALQTVVTDPNALTEAFKVTDKLLFDTVVAVPIALVADCPVGFTFASPSTRTDRDPTDPDKPGTDAIA